MYDLSDSQYEFGKSRFRNRNEAYEWLSRVMSVDPDQAHIGMFDAEQCRQLLTYLAEME